MAPTKRGRKPKDKGPVDNTDTTIPMTPNDIEKLVEARIAAAIPGILARANLNSGNNNNNHNTNNSNTTDPETSNARKGCTYKHFMSCKPKDYYGNDGAIGLLKWIDKIQAVFHIKDVRDLVITNGDAGRFFELNFLVIFYTVIGKMTQGSKVNTEFLTSLKDGAEIKSFDWCSYIVSCLNKTRIKWNGYQYYNGPLTFLLLVYVHDVYQRQNPKKKKVPGISFNTNESLNELDAQLIDEQNIIKQESTDSKVKGKANVDKVKLPLTLVNKKRKKRNDDQEDLQVIKKKKKTKNENEELISSFIVKKNKTERSKGKKNNVYKKEKKTTTSKPKSAEEWVVTIEEKTKELDNFVKDVEFLIIKCFNEIEDDDKILPPIEEWMSRLTKYKEMRKNEEKDDNDATVNTFMVEGHKDKNEEDKKEDTVKVQGDKVEDVDDNVKLQKQMEVDQKQGDKNEDVLEVQGHKDKNEEDTVKVQEMTEISPTFLGELIQAVEKVESEHNKVVKELNELSLSLVDEMIEAVDKVEADLEVKVDEDDDKIGDLIANLEFLSSNEADCQQTNKKSNEEKKTDDEVLFIKAEKPKNPVNRQKRIIKLSDALKSPYRQRIVQLNAERVKIEERISEWIFSATGEVWEILFDTSINNKFAKISFESFYPKQYIHIGVMSCWSIVLNHEEQFKSKDSTSRLFCTCNMLGENNFKARMRLNELLMNLETNLESTLLTSIYKSVEDVDILVVPILQDSHYYLICFNFKNETIDVIDNMKGKMKAKQKYRVTRMTQVMLNYLENHFESLHNKLDGVVPTKVNLPRQTDKNFVDCGVFAMRHMETYKGQPINEWANDCGLKEEAEQSLVGQLNDLRIKYLSKLLLSDVNLLRDKVISQLEDFEKIDISKREMLKKVHIRSHLLYQVHDDVHVEKEMEENQEKGEKIEDVVQMQGKNSTTLT
ncbi:hypothetical protein E3N88_02044 [Mikania micrantha]|uniref:Ubiquitin-like protease family profile domain-containing protein n=1 Tax=Mikania micrantha TaxID=192012 RepID=A0A5N6Q506_9ASTR|nr:hypothetical protein E3N88_02044 [Mikania micrantha]